MRLELRAVAGSPFPEACYTRKVQLTPSSEDIRNSSGITKNYHTHRNLAIQVPPLAE